MRSPAARALAGALWAVVLIALTVWAVSRSDEGAERNATQSDRQQQHAVGHTADQAPTPDKSSEAVPDLVVEVRAGRVVGPVETLDVALGKRVVIEVRSDTPDEVHLHGYDIAKTLGAHEPVQLKFEADIPGEFEIELEDRHLLLTLVRVR